MNGLILIPVFVCPAPNLSQQHESLPCPAPASCRDTTSSPSSQGAHSGSATPQPEGLPHKIPGGAAGTAPANAAAGGVLGDGSPALQSFDPALSSLPSPVRDLNIFLLYFVSGASTNTFSCVRAVGKDQNPTPGAVKPAPRSTPMAQLGRGQHLA